MIDKTANPSFNVQFELSLSNNAFSINLDLPNKGVIGVLGESGSGKTTLLRVISGLQPIDNGYICFNNTVWQQDTFHLPVHKRPIGYVFQEASLFSHLSIKQNLQFAEKRAWEEKQNTLKNASLNRSDIYHILNIEPLLNKQPHHLSGGERQRVAIARALMINPSILLMDEPLSALDYSRKQEVLAYLDKLKNELQIPIIYVSHSSAELARLADYLVVLENGKVKANGDINQVLTQTDLPSYLQKDVSVIFSTCVIEKDKKWSLQKVSFCKDTPSAELWINDSTARIGDTLRVQIFAKDVSIVLSKPNDSSINNILPCSILSIQKDVQEMMLIELNVDNAILFTKITQRSANHLKLKIGMAVWAQIKSVALIA
ncbi:molybdenum ABC transporter ATP-binding protein [Marinomonas sp. 2405UD68-3]|uniref:molybdenum ABC transporter ATP-binding protein n=1 Tax=Marinomonas sp. 2405UD68-3 TaxID=3391835 RepID=UPI0039C9C1CB